MKILFLHQHFKTPSSGGVVNVYMRTKALAEQGHRVVVIATKPEGAYQIENINGVEVHYLPIPYDNSFDFYRRGWAFLRFVFAASRLSKKFRDFDICYAISTPLTVGWAARWIKFRYGMPFIFEVGDLWPDAPIQMGYIRNPILKKLLFRMERKTYTEASSMLALSPAIQIAIEKKVPGKKVHMIPNMADCEFFHSEKKSPALEAKFKVTAKFTMSYIGAIGVANGLEFLLECARLSQEAALPIEFLICGGGALTEELKKKSLQPELRNLTFLPFTNREGVREIMNVTDAVWVTYKSVPILETGSPNKFFDGLAAGKLIMINFGGWIKKEVEENGCGVYVDPTRPEDFVTAIRPFLEDVNRLSEFQRAARKLGEEKYSRKKLCEEFVKIFER